MKPKIFSVFIVIISCITFSVNAQIYGTLTGSATGTNKLSIGYQFSNGLLSIGGSYKTKSDPHMQWGYSGYWKSWVENGKFWMLTRAANTSNWNTYIGMEGGSSNYGKLIFLTGNMDDPKERLVINKIGNVGIGTSAPDANLEIYESFFYGFKFWTHKYIDYQANLTDYETFGTRSGVIQFYHPLISQGEEVGGGWTQIRCGSIAIFDSDGNAKIQLNSWGEAKFEGDVYTKNLTVNGKITAEEIEVIRDVPDFDHVFNTKYNLTSLNEVEQYIKSNKHLPDIPSAQEFKENGYKVGEMDGLLLKKIEELTLYIIEQQKTIESLQSQMDQMAKTK